MFQKVYDWQFRHLFDMVVMTVRGNGMVFVKTKEMQWWGFKLVGSERMKFGKTTLTFERIHD